MKNKEFIFAEFIFENDQMSQEGSRLLEKLEKEGKLFILINHVSDANNTPFLVQAKIEPILATILKLQYPLLSERMRISYISDDLKNRYRK